MSENLREFLVTASIGGGRNFRPVTAEGRLGRIPEGRLFRSGHPGRLEAEALDAMRAVGLRTVVTLQTHRELELLDPPDRWGPLLEEDTRWEHIPIGERWFEQSDPYPSGLDEVGLFYLSMVLDHGEAWVRFFEVLALPDRLPLLVHCTAGRDRTGVATTLLLEALAIPRDWIREDYVVSNRAFDGSHAPEGTVLEPLFDAIDRAGGIERFLASLGLDETVLGKVRRNLLA